MLTRAAISGASASGYLCCRLRVNYVCGLLLFPRSFLRVFRSSVCVLRLCGAASLQWLRSLRSLRQASACCVKTASPTGFYVLFAMALRAAVGCVNGCVGCDGCAFVGCVNRGAFTLAAINCSLRLLRSFHAVAINCVLLCCGRLRQLRLQPRAHAMCVLRWLRWLRSLIFHVFCGLSRWLRGCGLLRMLRCCMLRAAAAACYVAAVR
jgi:hypothetical protein